MIRRFLLVMCFVSLSALSYGQEPQAAVVKDEPVVQQPVSADQPAAQEPSSVDQPVPPVEEKPAPILPFRLTSSTFEDGQPIPDKYTCKGADFSPPLLIQNAPKGTKSMVLTVHDPEGVVGTWVHWVVFAIPPDAVAIPEKFPLGVQALNDFGNFYYNGPCLQDQKIHKFIFTIYALNSELPNETEGATMDSLLKNIQGKVLAKAELVGTYQNSNAE
jgi:Raf kinase inhibitor-like YbhB/YbcL family protein